MTDLNCYLQDGASSQARAVLMMLQDMTIESSWNEEGNYYRGKPSVGRWENCREQGYCVMLVADNREQLNIAFFEHRNSDSICAVKWVQNTINTPHIDNAEFKDIYKDKFDISFSVDYGEIVKMADWIEKELINFWDANLRKPKDENN